MAENSQKQPLALVIDDQDDILQIVTMTLKFEGWRVENAHNGREAIEVIRRQTPDLILADLMMPEMNGLEFCRRLVDDLKLTDIPVLMISAVNERAKIMTDFWELPLRSRDFLHKPFTTEELMAAVRTIMPCGSEAVAPAPPAPRPFMGPSRPARPAANIPMITTPFSLEAGRGYRILIIDDDADIRMILKSTLGKFHIVEEAENGMVGVEMVDHFGPDIVISDVDMPLLNGLETAAAIRRHPAYGTVPIFFLTGMNDSALPRKVFDVGGNLYLRKPIDSIQLLKFIDHFLKETGMKPGELHKMAGQQIKAKVAQAAAKPKPQSETKTPAPAAPNTPPPPPKAPPAPVRILVIDGNKENHRILQSLLDKRGSTMPKVPGGPFETIYCDERALGLGNLSRWEPDVILYNPAMAGMDGIAFGQTLRLRKLAQAIELGFIGNQFFPSDVEYSRGNFHRDVIPIKGGEQELIRKLAEVTAAASAHVRPKHILYSQICEEETDRLRQLHDTNARVALQHEVLRERYAGLQDFIDRQSW